MLLLTIEMLFKIYKYNMLIMQTIDPSEVEKLISPFKNEIEWKYAK